MMQRPVEDQAALRLEVASNGVAWLIFDKPASRMNILTSGVMARLDTLLGEVEAGARAGKISALIVRSGKDGSFIAGANIDEIVSITDAALGAQLAAEGQRIFRRLDL